MPVPIALYRIQPSSTTLTFAVDVAALPEDDVVRALAVAHANVFTSPEDLGLIGEPDADQADVIESLLIYFALRNLPEEAFSIHGLKTINFSPEPPAVGGLHHRFYAEASEVGMRADAALVIVYPPRVGSRCPIGCPWCYARETERPVSLDWEAVTREAAAAVRSAAERAPRVTVVVGGDVDPTALPRDRVAKFFASLEPLRDEVEGLQFAVSTSNPRIEREDVERMFSEWNLDAVAVTYLPRQMFYVMFENGDYGEYVERMRSVFGARRRGELMATIPTAFLPDEPFIGHVNIAAAGLSALEAGADRLFLLRYHLTPWNEGLGLVPGEPDWIDAAVVEMIRRGTPITRILFDACLTRQLFRAPSKYVRRAEESNIFVVGAAHSGGCPRYGGSCQVKYAGPAQRGFGAAATTRRWSVRMYLGESTGDEKVGGE